MKKWVKTIIELALLEDLIRVMKKEDGDAMFSADEIGVWLERQKEIINK